ncbi:hypothetical protein MKS88_004966 [Plasmodium brasilianum]|uniref:Uncharacterized protein n=1 Tax=Plasmodium brasilianum TaxID=5824 RepID=A0ACB9Y457_PLABR|nr:hypothetical protein MKS88_004966 [Plasmodium brasilianum]
MGIGRKLIYCQFFLFICFILHYIKAIYNYSALPKNNEISSSKLIANLKGHHWTVKKKKKKKIEVKVKHTSRRGESSNDGNSEAPKEKEVDQVDQLDKEKEKKQITLIENVKKKLLKIEYIDENNESSDIVLKIHIKGKLREDYYDMCVKKYKEKKLKENKYEYSYLKDIPVNSLINYVDQNDYFKIFLKYVNEDIIKVYKGIKKLHLIGAPRLLNKIDHMNISKFNDIVLNFSIDKFPTIKFLKSYLNLDLTVKIPPYEKGNAFKEFLKIVQNENEVAINSDHSHKVEWNNDVYINILRGWVYSFNDIYYDEYCKVNTDRRNTHRKMVQGATQNKCPIDDKKYAVEKKYRINEELNIIENNKINDLIDIDKDEENFINNSNNYEENTLTNVHNANEENLFNETNDKDNESRRYYYDEYLKNADFSNYFKQGYLLPNDIIQMNNATILIKENYNPLGFNESLIGMNKNQKKNITVYLPISLFKDYFQKNNLTLDKNKDQQVINLKEINKESISKFREIIYTEIKKLKNNRTLQKLENILKTNENKFFDSNTLEQSLKKGNENGEQDGREERVESERNSKQTSRSRASEESVEAKETKEIKEAEYYIANKEEDIEYILNDNSVLFDEEESDEKGEPNGRSEPNESGESSDPSRLDKPNDPSEPYKRDEKLHFLENFDKYVEELLNEDINSLDDKLYYNRSGETTKILQNICDPSEYETEKNTDDSLNDYILGKSDLIKCVLEVEILDIKIRKKGNEDINDYVLKKYNKTIDELYEDIEGRAMKDIQGKCVDQRRMEAYKKLMEITTLNIPITLFRAQGKRLYDNYLRKQKMKKSVNDKDNHQILDFEEFIKKSQKEIYDQIKFSFIVKSIFQNSKLKVNYEHIIRDVIRTLIKTPTNNVQSLIKKIYTVHQAQCVLDFVSLNSNISFDINHNSSLNFSVSLKKGSSYTKEEFLNDDQQSASDPRKSREQLSSYRDGTNINEKNSNTVNTPNDNDDKISSGSSDGDNSNCDKIDCDTPRTQKIFNFTNESNFVIEKKKENNENVELEYYTFKKGANYTKFFQERSKKS